MADPNDNGHLDERAWKAVMLRLADWPTWLLVVCFIVLAIGFGLAGSLDDWLRALCAITFLAIGGALIGRAAHLRKSKTPPPL